MMKEVLFAIITWIPMVAMVVALILALSGWYLKLSGKPYQKVFMAALFVVSIPVVLYVLFSIIGMIDFGPGMLD
jgi:hypothetical protein